jgi:hypothetical protein
MKENPKNFPVYLRCAASLAILSVLWLPAGAFASESHAGLPKPSVELTGEEVVVPFSVPQAFPVPVVEVTFNGDGPFRLAVDTAMGGTILLRQDLAVSMGLPVIGKAMVGDSSGVALKPADLVRIDELILGGLTVRGIVGIGFSADDEHLSDVPDDLHGILGNQIYADLLTTLDYPGRRLVFQRGSLDADLSGTVPYQDKGGVMAVDLRLADSTLPVIVDSGHRGTITLPRSLARELPLDGELRPIDSLSTVATTYQREAAYLDGEAMLAESLLVDPEIAFADEHTPQLVGFGVLEHFAVTIDQKTRHIRFARQSEHPIEGIVLAR